MLHPITLLVIPIVLCSPARAQHCGATSRRSTEAAGAEAVGPFDLAAGDGENSVLLFGEQSHV